MNELLRIALDPDYNIQVTISRWLVLIGLLGILIWLFIVLRSRLFLMKGFEINETEIGIGSQKIKIKPNYDDIQIAYKLWIELSTRKIGLPINFEHDVIIEIYNSWFEFFRLTREMIKTIPISRIRRSDSTKKLVMVSIDVLNEGLRPHLTLWQAKFKRWYQLESGKEENQNLSPQELQRKYTDYEKLVKDMEAVNGHLINYRETLKTLAFGQ
jgi:hypothetical protein